MVPVKMPVRLRVMCRYTMSQSEIFIADLHLPSEAVLLDYEHRPPMPTVQNRYNRLNFIDILRIRHLID